MIRFLFDPLSIVSDSNENEILNRIDLSKMISMINKG